jgi:hypothetical protein
MLKTAKTTVLASGFWRLKAPRWHLGALWVSAARRKVYRIDLDGKVTIVADVPSRPFGPGLPARRRFAGSFDDPEADPEPKRQEGWRSMPI